MYRTAAQSKNKLRAVLALLLLFCGSSFKHPFYLSVTDLNYNPVQHHMEGAVKVFSNDLEEALKILLKTKVDLRHPANATETKKWLADYLHKRLSITSNSKSISYTVLGFELEEESIWIYLESENCPAPKSMTIENAILYDFIQEQMNIVNVEVNGQKKSWKVNCPEKRMTFDF